MAAPAAAAPVRLSAAGEAALKAEFGKAYDGVRLRASLQADIVAHFAGELPLPASGLAIYSSLNE